MIVHHLFKCTHLNIDVTVGADVAGLVATLAVHPCLGAVDERYGQVPINVSDTLDHWVPGKPQKQGQRSECCLPTVSNSELLDVMSSSI